MTYSLILTAEKPCHHHLILLSRQLKGSFLSVVVAKGLQTMSLCMQGCDLRLSRSGSRSWDMPAILALEVKQEECHEFKASRGLIEALSQKHSVLSRVCLSGSWRERLPSSVCKALGLVLSTTITRTQNKSKTTLRSW